MAPRVSVVVPAFDAAATLPSLIESLQSQTVAPLEVIVVDDASRDDTAQVAANAGARVVRHTVNAGPGRARNSGVEAASGDIVIFTDADCVAPADWIERSLAFMAEHGARVTTSGYLGPMDNDTASWFQHWEKRSREPRTAATMVATNGHSLCIERSLYRAVGGMSDIRTSEDFLFGLVVSDHVPVHFDPHNGVYHRFRRGLGNYTRQKMLFAQNTVLCIATRPGAARGSGTFSRTRTLVELAATLATAACTSLAAIALFSRAPSRAGVWIAAGACLLVARVSPFIAYVRGARRAEDRGPVGRALLYAHSVAWLLARDAATFVGLVRGLAIRRAVKRASR